MDNNTILCHCHNITVKDITDCIQSGKTTFEEIQASTLIGSSCPPCLETSKQHFETIKQSFIEELNNKTP